MQWFQCWSFHIIVWLVAGCWNTFLNICVEIRRHWQRTDILQSLSLLPGKWNYGFLYLRCLYLQLFWQGWKMELRESPGWWCRWWSCWQLWLQFIRLQDREQWKESSIFWSRIWNISPWWQLWQPWARCSILFPLPWESCILMALILEKMWTLRKVQPRWRFLIQVWHFLQDLWLFRRCLLSQVEIWRHCRQVRHWHLLHCQKYFQVWE